MAVVHVRKPAPAFGWLTAAIKLLALVVGGAATLLLGTSLLGTWLDAVWLQVAIVTVVAIGVPLLLADRLLPRSGEARPGLVTDVTAMTWMGVAIAALVLGPTTLYAAFEAEALRYDAAEHHRSAWSLRWIAGIPTPEPIATEPAPAMTAAPSTAPVPSVAAGAEYTVAPPVAERRPLEPAALFERWAPSVVTIRVGTHAMGTGFVIDGHGTIATNHHVVEGAERLVVKLYDGTEVENVELLETNVEHDLALIRVSTDKPLPPVALGVSDEVVVGEEVIVIGNPLGLEHTLTDGLVSARRLYEGKKYIQMSAPVSPGNSGGPVFNRFGDVVGVTVAKLYGENLNLAVPIDLLKPMIKSEYPNARGLGKSRW